MRHIVYHFKLGGKKYTLYEEVSYNEYMRWYTNANREKIMAHRKKNYKENLNGQRTKRLMKKKNSGVLIEETNLKSDRKNKLIL